MGFISKEHYQKLGNNTRKTSRTFIDEARAIHGDKYGYDNVVYINTRSKVDIACPVHGRFFQAPDKHLYRKQGCPECGKIKCANSHRMTPEVFLNKSTLKHNNEIIPLEDYISCFHQIKFLCTICNNEFIQKPSDHVFGIGCPVCKESKGSKLIRQYLKENNIEFETEKWFDKCRGIKRPLPFDYYLSDINTIIEFDGRQHYECVNFNGGVSECEQIKNLEIVKNHDNIKNEYCNNNNITLIRIPYLEESNIANILSTKVAV